MAGRYGSGQPKGMNRMVWMDVARGAAIVLIVLYHTRGDLLSYGVSYPNQLDTAMQFFEPFRIPMLVLLSGMLVGKSAKKGAKRYFDGKLRAIAWPFLLWTLIFLWVFRIDFDPSGLLTYLTVTPISVMWYLHFILIAYVAFYLLRRIPPLFLATTCIALSYFMPESYRIDRYVLLFGFFALGHVLASTADKWLPIVKKPVFIASSIVILIWVGVMSVALGGDKYDPAWMLWVLVAILGVIAILSKMPPNWLVTRALSFVGQNSIIYYVVHRPVFHIFFGLVAAGRDLEHRSLIIAVGVAIALVISTGLALLVRVHPIFALPFRIPTLGELRGKKG